MFSYGEGNSLNLSDTPITQLVGLNGHGKSSIPLIIEEVLFNKNSKGIKKGDIVNRNIDTNKYSASLSFKMSGVDYQIDISRSGATQKVKLSRDGTDISSHTATETFKQIESLIGLDFKTFSQIVYQNSSSSLQFLTATDTARKSFLIELLSLERYIKIFDQIKGVHKECSDSLISTEATLSSVRKWLERNESADLTYEATIDVPERDPSLSERLAEINHSIKDITATNARIAKNRQYIELRDSTEAKIPDTSPGTKIDISEDKSRVAVIKQAYKHANENVVKYTSKAAITNCPTCSQPVDNSHLAKMAEDEKALLTKYENELNSLSKLIVEAEAQNRKVTEYEKLLADFANYSKLVDDSIPQVELSVKGLREEADNLSVTITKMEHEIRRALETNSNVGIHNAKVEIITKQLDEYRSELANLTPKLDAINEHMGLLEVLKKAFSTNGLLAYKIESSVKELEELTNYYLSELSDGRFLLEFSLANDKLNVVIIDNGADVSISALSAGELARVTTATLLAIRKLMSSLSKCQLNILFLDETIDNLDAFGKEKLVEVLLEQEQLNTYLVSHSYSHPLIDRVTVVKENDISRLEK